MTWESSRNNEQFLTQTIVMTPNQTLSIPNALKTDRPEDYYKNAVTFDWPNGAYAQPLAIETFANRAAVFEGGRHVAAAKKFVSFLVGEGWLAHYLNFAGERMLPPMPKLLEAPFWLDPGDPHRMRSAIWLSRAPTTMWLPQVTGGTPGLYHGPKRVEIPGRTPSTASSPRGSARSRRSTTRSPA